jgi:hypothetical protein
MQNVDKGKALPSDYDDYDDTTLANEAKEALKRFEIRAQKRGIDEKDPEKFLHN